MSKEQWNSRYEVDEYIYGVEPNSFLKEFLIRRPSGRILFPADGEGRNSVFAATLGWQSDAFDQSEAGRDKAIRLSKQKGVNIQYDVCTLEEWETLDRQYDCVALLYVHLLPEHRKKIHQKMISVLQPGGYLLLEAFTKNQFPRTSGGPKNLDLLFDAEEIQSDFSELEIEFFSETQIHLEEGSLHKGQADVVRLIGKKR